MSCFTVAYRDAFGVQQVVSELSESEADALIALHGNGTRVEFADVLEANGRNALGANSQPAVQS